MDVLVLPAACRRLFWLCVFVLVAQLCGCATQTRQLQAQPPSGMPAHTELSATPFFAQEDYQCGPASLAMLLQARGSKVTPEQLLPQVYVPARKGSLQAEMVAAARRNGSLAVLIEPQMRALLDEVAAGHPVLVLQNLSLPVFPLWHYAVVIGYDLPNGDIILRSGTTERLVMSLSTFEHTWMRSQGWGMVALPPGQLPVAASDSALTDALVAFDKNASPRDARLSWQAALKRLPHELTVQLGAGNNAYATGDKEAALAAFRQAVTDHPQSVAALNNAASVLAELGRLDEAAPLAERAVQLGGPLQKTAQATLQDIEARRRR